MEQSLDYLYNTELTTFAGAKTSDGRIKDWQQECVQQLEKAVELSKSIVAGDASVKGPKSTGWSATQPEFLLGALTDATYQDEDCKIFNAFPTINVNNPLVQFVERTDLGTLGDGFIAELGPNANGTHTLENDPDYAREAEAVAIIHDVRRVSWLAQKTGALVAPVPEQQKAAIRNIKGKICMGTWYSDRKTNALGFNGFFTQILQGVRDNPQGRNVALWDADGKALNNAFMNHIFEVCANNLTMPDEGWMNPTDLSNWQNTLIQMQRAPQVIEGVVGQNVTKVVNQFSNKPFEFKTDFMLRAGKPLQVWGNGALGQARDENTVDPQALAFATTPFAACAAGAAGTGYFFENKTYNDMQTPLATDPAVPAATDGEAKNQLGAGTYHYAISSVYMGQESRLWVLGCTSISSSANLGTGVATTITVTAGQIVKATIDIGCITGLGTTYRKDLVRWRIYRAPAGSTKISDFKLVDDCGTSKTGNPTFYDNGWRKPGTRDILLINRNHNGVNLAMYAQQVDVARRPLPNNLLTDVQGYLTVLTPVLRRRTETPSHIWLRNVGDTVR